MLPDFSPARESPPLCDLYDDAGVDGFGLPAAEPDPEEVRQAMAEFYADELAATEEDLQEMEREALAIDPAACESFAGVKWCPRCGLGCCSIKPDPEDHERWVCSGGCDAHGQHHGDGGGDDDPRDPPPTGNRCGLPHFTVEREFAPGEWAPLCVVRARSAARAVELAAEAYPGVRLRPAGLWSIEAEAVIARTARRAA